MEGRDYQNHGHDADKALSELADWMGVCDDTCDDTIFYANFFT